MNNISTEQPIEAFCQSVLTALQGAMDEENDYEAHRQFEIAKELNLHHTRHQVIRNYTNYVLSAKERRKKRAKALQEQHEKYRQQLVEQTKEEQRKRAEYYNSDAYMRHVDENSDWEYEQWIANNELWN